MTFTSLLSKCLFLLLSSTSIIQLSPSPRILQDDESSFPFAVDFDQNSYEEHLENFRKIGTALKSYEAEYSKCLRDIPDETFTDSKIEACLGKDFIKVILDIKYETLKIMSRGDSKLRSIFLAVCYEAAGTIEEFAVACDLMRNDGLDFLWNGLDFVEILEINKEKYLSEYGKLPAAVWDDLKQALLGFSKEFFELLEEIDAHKDMTIMSLKTQIDDRIKIVIDAAKLHPERIQPQEVAHTIELEERLQDEALEGEVREGEAQGPAEQEADLSEERRELRQRHDWRQQQARKIADKCVFSRQMERPVGSSQSNFRRENEGKRLAQGINVEAIKARAAVGKLGRKATAVGRVMLNRLTPEMREQARIPFKNVHTSKIGAVNSKAKKIG